jgi:peptidyl-prolyl cis-trans isomerase C
MKHYSNRISSLCSAAILFSALSLSISALAQVSKPGAKDIHANLAQPFVTVNGEAQSNARAEVLLREQLGRGVPDSADLRNGVREHLINQAMMAQEARKTGLDKEPLVQAQIELARQGILAQAWQQKILSETTVKDEDLQAEYQAQLTRLGTQEYLVRHLLVADETTAKLLIEKLQSGAKMADLAAQYSRDNSTQNRGGLTDWSPTGNLLAPLAKAVAQLDKGKLATEPVRTDAGWHVLQLEDKRAFTAPTLESIKPQLTKIIAGRVLDARAKALKSQTKVQ